MKKIDIVKEWLDFSNKDFSSAKFLLNMHPAPYEIICYHCQQAAENVLKAYLIYHDVEPLRTHDLRLLCKTCSNIDSDFDEISNLCSSLTVYGVQPRYPFEIEINESDVLKAINDAEHIINFTVKKIGYNTKDHQ
ncbi:HEPN domain-containing protein [Thermoanaerobacterium thermosaccharolyticum]|uniref:HEPN domain-containing protein n=1 Tax=Thermoanaerobacterium thermosaccharolyticum TaxID=1517 RepID=UPI00177BF2B4|nr:HEPN domain-containing protein [Thermoanaerobacterium thermosaccharolyticum]MBE0067575.1 HEPN domain-containing protein [Thermoanaerobacterium thermosaccharolyticum]MBE0227159.1 HEPN domain-containing protein [Thermoanaerobacterium thermosaccharolyticum]